MHIKQNAFAFLYQRQRTAKERYENYALFTTKVLAMLLQCVATIL